MTRAGRPATVAKAAGDSRGVPVGALAGPMAKQVWSGSNSALSAIPEPAMVNDRYPNRYSRRSLRPQSAEGVPGPFPSAVLDAARRGSGRVDIGDLSAADRREFELEWKPKAAQARIRALEGAIKTTAKVLAPRCRQQWPVISRITPSRD